MNARESKNGELIPEWVFMCVLSTWAQFIVFIATCREKNWDCLKDFGQMVRCRHLALKDKFNEMYIPV